MLNMCYDSIFLKYLVNRAHYLDEILNDKYNLQISFAYYWHTFFVLYVFSISPPLY